MNPSTLAPTGRADRLDSLDIVRGFALFGILLMNIVAMGLPFAAYFNPAALGEPSPAEHTTWFITQTFFEGSMRTLFSMLFGAGFVLLLDRMQAKNLGLMGAKMYARRMLLLMLLGIVDIALLAWGGDILFAYGVAGLLLVVFYGSKIRGLVVWAVLISLIISGFNFAGGMKFAGMGAAYEAAISLQAEGGELDEEQVELLETWPDKIAFIEPNEAAIAEALDAHAGWASLVGANMGERFGIPVIMFVMFSILDPLGAMLVGMIAFRLGLLQNRWSVRALVILTIAAGAVGLPVNWMETRAIIDSGYTIHGFFESLRTYEIGRYTLAFFWLGIFLLLCKSPLIGLLKASVGAVGRMALTNYLAHSAIALILFVGLGWFGELARHELYYVVAGMWAFNLVFSMAWLSVFTMGPVEWLWRAGTYGYWPPLLKGKGKPVSPAVPQPGM
ncbi:DUF418 domain-containing protein [Maricaulis sp. CAU 1757]